MGLEWRAARLASDTPVTVNWFFERDAHSGTLWTHDHVGGGAGALLQH